MGTTVTRKTLVTEGAGFAGSNLCGALLDDDHNVIVCDSFARPGTETNLAWLRDVAAILSHPPQETLRCASW